jgi:uncharacterized protein YndB with AHSA1/START domain
MNTMRTLLIAVLGVVSLMQGKPESKDLALTRVFDASIDRVWKVWSDGDEVRKWWGPKVFTSPLAKMDFREVGSSLVCMRSPDGHDMYNTWTYTRIVPNERIEFVLDWADKDGKRVDPVSMGLPPNMPRDVRHVITFKRLAPKKTEMTITEFGYTSQEHFDLSKAGLEECLDKMAALFKP